MIVTSVRQRILLVSLVSTTVEFYSFFVYATAAAVVLGPLYFPSTSHVAQLLSAWGWASWARALFIWAWA